MSEPFDLDAYLRCDCASVGNQTCDKCVVRSYIAALSRDLEEARECNDELVEQHNAACNYAAEAMEALSSLQHGVLEVIGPIVIDGNYSDATLERLAALQQRLSRNPSEEAKP